MSALEETVSGTIKELLLSQLASGIAKKDDLDAKPILKLREQNVVVCERLLFVGSVVSMAVDRAKTAGVSLWRRDVHSDGSPRSIPKNV